MLLLIFVNSLSESIFSEVTEDRLEKSCANRLSKSHTRFFIRHRVLVVTAHWYKSELLGFVLLFFLSGILFGPCVLLFKEHLVDLGLEDLHLLDDCGLKLRCSKQVFVGLRGDCTATEIVDLICVPAELSVELAEIVCSGLACLLAGYRSCTLV